MFIYLASQTVRVCWNPSKTAMPNTRGPKIESTTSWNVLRVSIHNEEASKRILRISLTLAYSDSVLIASELTKKNDKIGSALLTKGIVYYSGKDYNKALDCYLYTKL